MRPGQSEQLNTMPALNCKVGDLAIVVATELPENLGQIVEVLGLQTGIPFTMSGLGHIWEVRAVNGRKTLNYRFNEAVPRFVEFAKGPAPDCCLRPVSGLTDLDAAALGTMKRRPAPRHRSKRKGVPVVT